MEGGKAYSVKHRRRRVGLSFSQKHEEDYDDEKGYIKGTMLRLESDPVL